MTALEWDKVGERLFEAGVTKGVLYGSDGVGIAWNGLISVDDNSEDTVEPVYFDGVKVNDVLTSGDFSGTLRAYTYPDEFLQYEGILEYQQGFFFDRQPHGMFGLSFRTNVGNDVDGTEHGYKIHLLYNVTAVPQQKTYKSLSLDVEPIEFEWNITAIPEQIDFFRPTAHVILDSTKLDPYLLADIEEILYGSDEHDAKLPSLKALSSLIRTWNRFVVTDNGDGTWTAHAIEPDVITMLDSITFQIVTDTATFLDADTYTITSTDKNEDDIWLP